MLMQIFSKKIQPILLTRLHGEIPQQTPEQCMLELSQCNVQRGAFVPSHLKGHVQVDCSKNITGFFNFAKWDRIVWGDLGLVENLFLIYNFFCV